MNRVRRSTRIALLITAVLVVVGLAGTAVYAAAAKPGLSLGANPTSQSLQQGQTATTTVTLTGTNGFSGSVLLGVSGLPTGAKASFSPASIALSKSVSTAKSTLSVTTTNSTPVSTRTLQVTGTSGNTKSSMSLSLTVTAPLNGSFAIAAAPSSISVAPGSAAASTVAVVRTAPFAGAVALSTTALPTGVTAAFNPTTTAATAGTSSSTLKLSVSTRGKDGSYSVPIVGTYTSPSGQRYYAYGQLQLVVNSKQTAQPFGLSGTVNKPLAPGSAAQPVDLTISNSNAQPLPVTNLSVMVQGTSAGSACDRTNFAVTQYSGPYPLTVPAGQTRALSSLGVPSSAWPKLQMVNLPRNQDGCKATTVSLDYSGSAQGN